MRKQVFADSLVSLPGPALRLLCALLERVSAIELYSGKLTASLEKDAARLSGLTEDELLISFLLKMNAVIQNNTVSYLTREDFIVNTNQLVDKAIAFLSRDEKSFQGDYLIDLLVYVNEKTEKAREKHGEEMLKPLEPEADTLVSYLRRMIEGSTAVIKSISNQRLREQIYPFVIYCMVQWYDESLDSDSRISRFLAFWNERKGIYDHLEQKLKEHAYKIDLEERLLDQKLGNIKTLQKQLDQIVDEKEKVRDALIQRIPHDLHKLEGTLGDKGNKLLAKLAQLADRKPRGAEKDDEGILRSLWNKIDASISDHSTDREMKKVSAKLVDEMLQLKKDIAQLPVFYMDRIKLIYDCDSKIQEIRRWRYQLDQEADVHKDTIKHHKDHSSTIERQMRTIEYELFRTGI
ncbi:hypothetical protein PP175_08275 [Aneurinibacillus sp. Ricciae_BoGa-3]|uniref:hypothetical protein n=1 Tax=Aneurinibacillus sp. Ricciae_BoGa-3 TaxID=3022697 RepID=UPI0023416627|nr:hypothetical protein [Aneurinibacillus sp. Ricciae_BoGa-3]WCK55900.1 hypothetical protein PP175_08275 [Aneurinibacillus sp. Ricciae_BoGa-3]